MFYTLTTKVPHQPYQPFITKYSVLLLKYNILCSKISD